MNGQQVGTITIQANNDPELKSLIRSLIEEQAKTNTLLEQLNERSETKETFSHAEAAEFLGISSKTLYGLCSEKKIRRFKSGGKNLFKRFDLKTYLEDHAIEKRQPFRVEEQGL